MKTSPKPKAMKFTSMDEAQPMFIYDIIIDYNTYSWER